MSHIVTQKTDVRDLEAIKAACTRIGIDQPVSGSHKLFSSQQAAGLAIRLPKWNYPVVINPETGDLKYDNYGGHWGDQVELDKFVQAYTIEYTSAQARMNGYLVNEVPLENGDVRVQLQAY